MEFVKPSLETIGIWEVLGGADVLDHIGEVTGVPLFGVELQLHRLVDVGLGDFAREVEFEADFICQVGRDVFGSGEGSFEWGLG